MWSNQPVQSIRRILSVGGVILSAIAATLFLTGGGRSGFDNPCQPGETNCVVLAAKDFSPQDGSWNINWPGPPRRELTFSDLEHFTVNLQLDRNAPQTFSRDFLIREDRWYGWDTLGQFTATFAAGSRTPSISYPSQCCGATGSPSGTPNPLVGSTFWVGCTKRGRVKANGRYGDDGNATIRLEKVNKSDGIGVKGK